jgi:hypothetical protein
VVMVDGMKLITGSYPEPPKPKAMETGAEPDAEWVMRRRPSLFPGP